MREFRYFKMTFLVWFRVMCWLFVSLASVFCYLFGCVSFSALLLRYFNNNQNCWESSNTVIVAKPLMSTVACEAQQKREQHFIKSRRWSWDRNEQISDWLQVLFFDFVIFAADCKGWLVSGHQKVRLNLLKWISWGKLKCLWHSIPIVALFHKFLPAQQLNVSSKTRSITMRLIVSPPVV